MKYSPPLCLGPDSAEALAENWHHPPPGRMNASVNSSGNARALTNLGVKVRRRRKLQYRDSRFAPRNGARSIDQRSVSWKGESPTKEPSAFPAVIDLKPA
jgi:hypothetical protein